MILVEQSFLSNYTDILIVVMKDLFEPIMFGDNSIEALNYHLISDETELPNT